MQMKFNLNTYEIYSVIGQDTARQNKSLDAIDLSKTDNPEKSKMYLFRIKYYIKMSGNAIVANAKVVQNLGKKSNRL